MISSNVLAGLNPQQRDAVTLPQESSLILAGAGSGKTRVLTTRIAWLIQTGQVGPHGILAVTFTNKAAREMLTRISAMLPINTRGMWVGTFHGLCNRLLRAHFRQAGLPQAFQILDTQDQLGLIKRVLRALNVDEEKYPPRELMYFINSNKEAGRRPPSVETQDEFYGRMTELYAQYERQCNHEGVVDFAELLLRCFELLSRNEILREHYQQRFAHILVDEFQDTNRLQYQWLKLLAGAHNSIFAVGDDDQSIYAFRGASSRNMFEFERDFAKGRVIKLEQNYRSQSNILDAANALISHNKNRLGKNLWTAEGSSEALRLYEAPSDLDEAAFIVDEVKALRSSSIPLSQIALLYRSNAQSRVLEHALFNAAIPYRVYGGLRFFERQEIKHALAYLRLVSNPNDDGAFLRVVNIPARGVGGRTLEVLQANAQQRGISVWEAACSTPLTGKAGQGVAQFVRLIEELRRESATLSLAEIVETVVERSGLKGYYAGERDGQDRIENLDELVNAAVGFQSEEASTAIPDAAAVEGPPPPADNDQRVGVLDEFLSHAALEAGEHQAAAGAEALQLMTVHSAKGLEVDAVFICGLEEGLFPHENSLNEADGVEEERRLMYVAITRARTWLYLTHAQTRMLHGHTRYNIPSRFLHEIPPGLLRRLGISVRRGYGSATTSATVLGYNTSEPPSPWRVGQDVSHPKFGSGTIVSVQGRGADARVMVNFRHGGMKELALEYAKLTAV